MKEIYFAGGCFWGIQRYFDEVKGVIGTQVGYANGKIECPTYEDVCCGDSGFAEAIRIQYDETQLKLENLLELFFRVVDPTLKNRQGNDIGEQYRSGIYYIDEQDAEIIHKYFEKIEDNYSEQIVTEIEKLNNYDPAEDYHQKYLEKNPGGYCHLGKEAFQYAGNYSPNKKFDVELG